MSIENLVHAMPKVDVNVQFEGAVNKEFILLVAEQTDIIKTYKKRKEFDNWVALLKAPDYSKLYETAYETTSWVRHPDDLARAIYDLGVAFSKQNISYAEVSIVPSIYMEYNLNIVDFLSAIVDGADRAERAWKVKINWILSMPRSNPRKSDDIARWATGATAQKSNVIGLGLLGTEKAQPIAQFQRAFNTAEKRALYRVTHLMSDGDHEEVSEVLETVKPNRITDSWQLLDNGDALSYVIEHDIPVVVTPSREVALGRIDSIADYPIQELLEYGVNIVISAGMQNLYNTTLENEYTQLVQQCGLTVDQLQLLAAMQFGRLSYHPAKNKPCWMRLTKIMLPLKTSILLNKQNNHRQQACFSRQMTRIPSLHGVNSKAKFRVGASGSS